MNFTGLSTIQALQTEFIATCGLVWISQQLVHQCAVLNNVFVYFLQTLKEVADGYRLPRPLCCPEKLYEVMLKCW